MMDELLVTEDKILVCLYPNDQIEEFKKQLVPLDVTITYLTDVDSCVTLMESLGKTKKKILFIVYHSYLDDILSHLHTFARMDCILIYCTKEDQAKCVDDDRLNIKGVYDHIDLLRAAIEEQMYLFAEQSYQWAVYDQEYYSSRDLSRQANAFLWLQLFPQVIGDFPYEEQLLDSFFRLSIDRETYQSTGALHWYLNNPFVREVLWNALQRQDMNELYNLRDFLFDLITNLKDKPQRLDQSNLERFAAYRWMTLSAGELKHLRQKQGQLLSYKGFLSATRTRSSPSQQTDSLDVLFEIECHQKQLYENEEILFNLGTTFQLVSIEQHEQIWHVRLAVVDTGMRIAQKYLEDIRRHMGNVSVGILFGRLIFELSGPNQSQRYFQRLRHEDPSWIDRWNGRVLYCKGACDEARTFYDRAYKRMLQSDPPRLQDSAVLLDDIGNVLNRQGQYEQALELHQRALAIRETSDSPDDLYIANSLESIGLVYRRWEKNNEALNFLQRALAIREKVDPFNYASINSILSDIADVLYEQNNLADAFEFEERSLKIRQTHRSFDHKNMLDNYNQMTKILRDQERYDEAMIFCQHALSIYEEHYPSDHLETSWCLARIAGLLNTQNEPEEALLFYRRALTIAKKHLPHAHDRISDTHINIANIYYKKNQFDDAIDHFSEAVVLLEQFDGSNHADISRYLKMISICWYKKESYALSIEYLQRCLALRESNLPPEHASIAAILSYLSEDHESLNRYDLALHYGMQCYLMREKVLPTNDIDLGRSLARIGVCYQQLNQLNMALEYYQRALNVYKLCPSCSEERRSAMEEKVQALETELGG